jgi:hypothetical protein
MELTREQMREVLKRQREAYEQMEVDRLCTPWREATLEEKVAFDELMQDVNLKRGPPRECGMVEWYAKLLNAAE